MDNKQNIKGIGGLLTVYLVFLYISVIGQVFSLFLVPVTVSWILLTGLSFFAIISIYKKSQHAPLINKLLLFFQIIISIFGINQSSDPQLSSSIMFGSGSGFVADTLFLLYWFTSRRVKNTFMVEQTITTSHIDNSANVSAQATTGVPIPMDNHIKESDVMGVVHRTNFTLVLLLLPGLFIFTGFGIFFFVPIALIFSIFFAVYFIHLFKKNHTPTSQIYLILFSFVLGYISLALNIGGVSDSSHPYFILPAWLGIPTDDLEQYFDTLFRISQLYFVLLFFLNIFTVNKKNIKYNIYTCLLGIILIGSNVGLVFTLYPEAKKVNDELILREQEQSIIRLNNSLAFDFEEVRKNTFTDRKASIFTPIDYSKSPEDKCVYAARFMDYSLDSKPFLPLSIYCFNQYPKSEFPITSSGIKDFSWKLDKYVEKGDIVFLVIDLPKGDYLRVYTDNNPVRETITAALSEDIQDGIDLKSAAEINEAMDKLRTVMILYPINKEKMDTLHLLVARKDTDPAPFTIKEFGFFRTKN